MKETIRLETIDPIEIYGAANRNLEALCRDCHKQEHPEFGGKKTQRRYFVDENGRVISIHDDDFDLMTPPVND